MATGTSGCAPPMIPVVPLNMVWGFYRCDYTQTDDLRMGYQCPYCRKHIYIHGRYGIEAGNLIICHKHQIRCVVCNMLVPFPVLMDTLEEIDAYVADLHMRGGEIKLLKMSDAPQRFYCTLKR